MRATEERARFFLRQEGDRKATGVRQKSDSLVDEYNGDKTVHEFSYRCIYVKKIRSNVLHLFGFLLESNFIVSCIDF